MPPKVFISHASEDKQRFVVNFAKQLRDNGVDAWLDQWEMKPGDSLVDKIFEEGLKEASAVIIVLSTNSVRKPWVLEELNTSVGNGLVMYDHLCLEPALADVPQQELLDSLEILGQKYFIKIARVLGAPLSNVVLTDFGFQQFAEACVPDYHAVVTRIAALLVNESVCQNMEIASRVEKPVAFVDFVLNLMEANNHIKVSKYLGGQSQVWEISPSLRRALQQA